MKANTTTAQKIKACLRFEVIEYGHADVYAKHKETGKWLKFGECHSASVPILRESMARFAELVKVTYKANA